MKRLSITFLFAFFAVLSRAEAVEVDPSTLTCENLGFTMKEAQCYSDVIRCPFDTTKVNCIDAYIGEIRIFAGPESRIPSGWIPADGRSLPSATYGDLYKVIGTYYGGTSSQFKVPELSGRIPVGKGSSGTTGSTPLYKYNKGGEAAVTLTVSELPSHKHIMSWGESEYNSTYAPWGTSGGRSHGGSRDTDDDNPWCYTSSVGGNTSHNNMPPYLALYYIIYTGVHG